MKSIIELNKFFYIIVSKGQNSGSGAIRAVKRIR